MPAASLIETHNLTYLGSENSALRLQSTEAMKPEKRTQILLWARSVLMTILFPGFVAGFVPFFFLLPPEIQAPGAWSLHHYMAATLIGSGLAILLRCIWEFGYFGKGTLAPFDEPQKLVVQGLYRYVRNPMYVGVLLILLGEAWFFRSTDVMIYAGIFFLVSSLFVIVYEERRLRWKFGEEYENYSKQVRRWVPGKPYHPAG